MVAYNVEKPEFMVEDLSPNSQYTFAVQGYVVTNSRNLYGPTSTLDIHTPEGGNILISFSIIQ